MSITFVNASKASERERSVVTELILGFKPLLKTHGLVRRRKHETQSPTLASDAYAVPHISKRYYPGLLFASCF
jgi:hypothetical protein